MYSVYIVLLKTISSLNTVGANNRHYRWAAYQWIELL